MANEPDGDNSAAPIDSSLRLPTTMAGAGNGSLGGCSSSAAAMKGSHSTPLSTNVTGFTSAGVVVGSLTHSWLRVSLDTCDQSLRARTLPALNGSSVRER